MIKKEKFPMHLLSLICLLLLSTTTLSETFRLTAAGPQSANLPFIGVISSLVVPESNKRLQEMGSEHRIAWREAYGGSLYKWQDSLEAIEVGLTDIGWVGALWETSKMPLQNVTYYTPFVTDDLPLLVDIFNELHETMPELSQAWDNQNQLLLGASGVETYHLMTTFPVNQVQDLEGRKILAPGASATWLEGTGAVAVNGGLSTYYTQLDTGVADGVLTVRSVKENEEDDNNLYRGISYRKFNRKFTLADDIIVTNAKLQDGLLNISLERVVPEEKKPRLIDVK